MPLTDARIRNAKAISKSYKLSDGGGMYLLVTSDGARHWRLDYRFAGKRRTLSLGIYPTVTLASARARREEARALLAKEQDPSAVKKATKRARRLAAENTFEAVAREVNLPGDLTRPLRLLVLARHIARLSSRALPACGAIATGSSAATMFSTRAITSRENGPTCR
jgi:Arm domain-containing DNA-binding protein